MTAGRRRSAHLHLAVAIGCAALIGALLPHSPAVPSDAPVDAAGATPAAAPPPVGAATLGIRPPLSAVLVEARTGQVLVAGDADVRRPVASAIKLVTALAVVDVLAPGTAVEVGEEVRGIEGSSFELRPGDVRSVEDLLAGLLLRSGNDAAVALAVAVDGSEETFVERMADVLASIGIDARPRSSSGLEVGDALSASELATVSRAALADPRLRPLLAAPTLVLADGTVAENRNLFLLDTPDATGLKTGFTSQAGFTLAASAMRDGRELVAVVLGAEDDLARRELAGRLLEHGFARTVVLDASPSVTLRTTGGDVLLRTMLGAVTVPHDATVTADWRTDLRPDGAPSHVELRVDGTAIGRVAVVRDAPSSPGGGSEGGVGAQGDLGRSLADGVYAALRPRALSTARTGER